MFYNSNIQQNSVLSVPWQLGTDQKPLHNVEFPKICSTMKKWMDVDMNKKKHISLRTSAILVHGTAKLYRDEAKRLWEDCIEFYDQTLWTKVPRCSILEEDSITDSSMEELNPSEEQTQRSSQEAESVAEKSPPERTSQRKSSSRTSRENESNEDKRNSQKRRTNKERSKTVSKETPRRTQVSETRDIQPSGSLENQTENTYVISREERQKYARWNLNENLPMAVVLTFGTTVKPKDIIVSNIRDVNF